MSKKIIVVGNGIFTRLQGVEIDKFDMIVRLSSAKVRDYEPLVGSRTDVVSVARIEDVCDKNAIIWAGNPCGLTEIPQEALRKAYPRGAIFNESYNICRKYCNFPSDVFPTVGLLTIFMAMQFGKYFYDLPITITGFDFLHAGCSIYYYDNRKAAAQSKDELSKIHHSFSLERKICRRMIEEGLVKYLYGPDVQLLEDEIGQRTVNYKGVKL